MDSRYTNREKYLDGLSNRLIAEMICKATDEEDREWYCDRYCPLYDTEKCAVVNREEDCITAIGIWLGEKA